MSNIKIKNCGLAYMEKEGSLIPILDFSIERRRFLGSDEVSLYYDGNKYSGDKIGIDGWVDLDEDEVKFYSDYVIGYEGIIDCTEDIAIALNYFYQNKLCTTGLKFISKTKDGHFAIDCTYSDWYGENFKTKKESIDWLSMR